VANPPLTRRQHQILEYYRAYSAEHGLSPTLEEVARHFGVNKVTIFGHVAELERKGILQRSARGVSRALRVVEKPAPRRATVVPLLGAIAAGSPIEALESPETLDLADLLPRGRDTYALRVRGDSMIEDGIHDDDVVLVERRSNARDGELVVAILPGEEATLKRVYREAGGYRLEPANRTLQPIQAPRIEIRGVVIGVLRRY
jgi:repressor LexA